MNLDKKLVEEIGSSRLFLKILIHTGVTIGSQGRKRR